MEICLNITFVQRNVYFIDVSQSVEHEHPSAMDFLRMDCSNVTIFSKGLATMSTRELFTFITNEVETIKWTIMENERESTKA